MTRNMSYCCVWIWPVCNAVIFRLHTHFCTLLTSFATVNIISRIVTHYCFIVHYCIPVAKLVTLLVRHRCMNHWHTIVHIIQPVHNTRPFSGTTLIFALDLRDSVPWMRSVLSIKVHCVPVFAKCTHIIAFLFHDLSHNHVYEPISGLCNAGHFHKALTFCTVTSDTILRGDNVSMLTHTYPHKHLRKI